MKDEDRELEAIVRTADLFRDPTDKPMWRLPIRKPAAPAKATPAKPKPKPKRSRRPQRAPFDVDKVHRHDGKPIR